MKKVFYNTQIRRMQKMHVLLYALLPAAVWIAGIAVGIPFTAEAGLVAIFMWLFTGIGVSVGYHRLFTHRSFKTHTPMAKLLAVAGMMAGPGPVLSWVANHRMHHQHSDEEGDPHSPNLSGTSLRGRLKGLWHAHYGWMVDHPYANPLFYCPDLVRMPWLRNLCNYYHLWVWIGLLSPALLYVAITKDAGTALSILVYGGFARLFVVYNIISSVNSIGHAIGARRYPTNDHSRNNLLVALLAIGEGWHNNHHAAPYSAYLGHTRWQVDLGGAVIRAMRLIGLAWEVKGPDLDLTNGDIRTG